MLFILSITVFETGKKIIAGTASNRFGNQHHLRILQLPYRLTSIGLLLTFNFSFITFNSCGLDIEDPTPPTPPVWVQKSLPEEWPERGIDAHESGGIFLEWEPPLEDNIISYVIERAIWYDSKDSLGAFLGIGRIDMESSPHYEFIDTQASYRTDYYYRIYNEDSAGNLSEYSDSLFYYLLLQVSNQLMSPNGITIPLSTSRTLSWTYSLSVELERYCITVLSEINHLIIRENIMPGNYSGGRELWTIPDEIMLTPGRVYKWRIDTGAKYFDGRERAGSESHWATFFCE